MRKYILILMALLPLMCYAQEEKKEYYLYNIVTFSGSLTNEGFRVDIDNGVEIKRLRDEEGNKITFRTPAGALTYLFSKGWELYVNGATMSGSVANGYGASSTSTYWIMRKPCTKEEFEKAVEDSVKK